MSHREWRERAYEETLEGELGALAARRKIDPSFAIADAEGTLRHLYVQEGNDQIGRGLLQDIILGATIAAYEQFIDMWRKERTQAYSSPAQGVVHEPGNQSGQEH
jgi:hypothetical protein